MFLLILVVVCYTICSLSDKYAVSTAKFNGDELGFLMAAATAFSWLAVCLSSTGLLRLAGSHLRR